MSELRNSNPEFSKSETPERPEVVAPSENNREKLPLTGQSNMPFEPSFRDPGEKGNYHPESKRANEKDLPSVDPGAKLSPHPSVVDQRNQSENTSRMPEQQADGNLPNRDGVDRLPQRSDVREAAQGISQPDLNPESGDQQKTSEQSGEQQPNSKRSDVGKANIDDLSNPNEKLDDQKPSFFDRIGSFFHRDSKPQEAEEVSSPQWDGMETAPAPNGSGWTVLPGNHFDQYKDINNNYEDHPRTAIPKDDQEFRRVNPADIEGVHLGDSEVENPDRFWDMHNGSKEDWKNTASKIPEVQQRLDNGESLDSLLGDDQLGRCAQAYFNPNSSKAIEVDEMPNGGYMFNGDGRHRIIAARQAGHDIPVKVVGYRD